ncbi:transposase family protein, partial [Streptomyces sp. NPDC000961]|uniref:transposase family protein n=1 Tax=Streptomyces sp. NPDC000961 TaxID=3364541 RepID=UPI0036B10D60
PEPYPEEHLQALAAATRKALFPPAPVSPLTRQILVLADRAYQGAGATFRTPYKNHREQPEHYQQFNRDHARLQAPGERAFAQLKSWRLLRRARCSTRRISTIVQAVHTLLTCNYSG